MSPKQKDPVTETCVFCPVLRKKEGLGLLLASWALDANGHCPLWSNVTSRDTIGVI